MKLKSYVLIAALMMISIAILIKDTFSNNEYMATRQAALILEGQTLDVRVDIYRNAKGVQRLKIINPIELNSITIDGQKQ